MFGGEEPAINPITSLEPPRVVFGNGCAQIVSKFFVNAAQNEFFSSRANLLRPNRIFGWSA